MPRINPIRSPSRFEKAALRCMILLGTFSGLGLFVWLLHPAHIGYAPLYWLLMVALIFIFLKVLHEWYHYFFITVPATPPLRQKLSVDIFTTYCPDEPREMVVDTLKAIVAIEYPHQSYLCDDGNDPYLKQVCEELGVHHVTRKGRKDAKAGNINNALSQSTGEICVILDPDHVPAPDMLHRIVPHFQDEGIGFVQIVQAYKNHHESLVAKGAAQQTYQFYGPMMMTMNHYGTVLAIGANCSFRRKALESIGGHAAGLAEDMHTAMHLHARGWRSVYVPVVLTRGLVPSSLSGYFKQQLKWTRGTFELLINTYPKLFRKFSLAQKIHYAVIPFHYFSGVIFFINFLIPVLSLLFAEIPLRVDLLHLAWLSLPLMASVLLIRQFVQRWVMEEEERGFHMVGGILQIGTWWINVLGIVYSLLRKEVPYDPTPKDGKEGNALALNMPNILVGVLSLTAIVFGLYIDWNPFSIFMAGLALLNCSFVVFMLMVGFQPKIRGFRTRQALFNRAMNQVTELRKGFWHFKHGAYRALRQMAVPLLLLALLSSFYFYRLVPEPPLFDHYRQHDFYTGLYHPASDTSALTDLNVLDSLENLHPGHFDLISLYLAWRDTGAAFPPRYLEQIRNRNALPLITWEPWVSHMALADSLPDLAEEQRAMAHIAAGRFNDFLQRAARQLRDFGQPVFLRFAHEPDNPAYPWSARGGNSPQEYRQAWRHVHRLFTREGAHNVIWVWNPWSPEGVSSHFPGHDYIDWIGLTLLNYDQYNYSGQWEHFENLYLRFDSTGIFEYQHPVMLAEYGSLQREKRQTQWLVRSFSTLDEKFPEVRALVYFNSNHDRNVPGAEPGRERLKWQVQEPAEVWQAQAEIWTPDRSHRKWPPVPPVQRDTATSAAEYQPFFAGRRGINFHKGKDWLGNYDNLLIREVVDDFRAIRELGMGHVKCYGPGIYDRNVFRAARLHELDLTYGFWIPPHLDYVRDSLKLRKLEEEILGTVKRYKDREEIVAWNLGNSPWHDLANTHFKPRWYYQQAAFLRWYGRLVQKIKALDTTRPLTADLNYDAELAVNMAILKNAAPGIDAFGLLVRARDTLAANALTHLPHPWFFSAISAPQYLALPPDLQAGVYIDSWQEQRTATYASFAGITDIEQRQKRDYRLLREHWQGVPAEAFPWPLEIVTPVRPIYEGQKLKYYAAYRDNEGWQIDRPLPDEDEEWSYHWYLVKTDRYGQPLRMIYRGSYHTIKINIPRDHQNYRLRLYLCRGNDVWTWQTTLHRPYQKPEMEDSPPEVL